MDRGSYDPEGIKKNPDALIDELKGFYSSVERFGKQLNDPNNIMGDVLNELKKFNGAFAPATNWSDPNDQRDKSIELPSELTPETQDRNVIEVDPFGVRTRRRCRGKIEEGSERLGRRARTDVERPKAERVPAPFGAVGLSFWASAGFVCLDHQS